MSAPELSPTRIANTAQRIRRRVLAHTLSNNGGYLSQACSTSEALATLYSGLMRLGPSLAPSLPLPFAHVPGPGRPYFSGALYNGPREDHLDRFIFSPVHYALVLYATLIECGRMGPEALDLFNTDGSTVELIGAEHSPGHEVTAGSLAQALSQAAGIALARKIRRASGRVWVFMSDGEFQEGQTWEAIAAMAFHEIDNLTMVVDCNGQQCDGAMQQVMNIEPLAARITAFGGLAHELDGHDPAALIAAAAQPSQGRPVALLLRTDPCRGIDALRQRAPKLHYVRFKNDAERQPYIERLAQLNEELPS